MPPELCSRLLHDQVVPSGCDPRTVESEEGVRPIGSRLPGKLHDSLLDPHELTPRNSKVAQLIGIRFGRERFCDESERPSSCSRRKWER